MSVQKIAGNLLSCTNENTAALVNIKFDLSLIRCEPLAEFLPVGRALTPLRKQEAESGDIHRTACILGFLFNDSVPDTPALRKAFGSRVSKILSHPDINPQGTQEHGPFQAFIGADGTSIWAAATSGDASISVLLLACLLANAFDSKAATALWVELIKERKRSILRQLENGKFLNPNTEAAARHEISRQDLAKWDASVRSWKRRADLFMHREKIQLALIAENLNIPYPGGSSTCEKVTVTWKRAMEVLENLLNNHPQQACDRAILLGISSWHLYPDLLVFKDSPKKVEFHDIPSAVLTLGIEYIHRPSDDFIRWSLALSHLRYYGDPVPVHGTEGLPRVPFSQLWLITLGILYRQWNIRNSDMARAVQWFAQLGNKLKLASASHYPELSWLLKLCLAAAGVGPGTEETSLRLVKFGWRRGINFLGRDNLNVHTPFFGLCNRITIKALHQESERERGIEFIRQHLSLLSWKSGTGLISFDDEIMNCEYTEWATVSPIVQPSEGANPPEAPGTAKHARWIRIHQDPSHPGFDRIVTERRMAIEKVRFSSWRKMNTTLLQRSPSLGERTTSGVTLLQHSVAITNPAIQCYSSLQMNRLSP